MKVRCYYSKWDHFKWGFLDLLQEAIQMVVIVLSALLITALLYTFGLYLYHILQLGIAISIFVPLLMLAFLMPFECKFAEWVRDWDWW